MNKKKILITGGAGYIGSHTVTELISAGYDVVIVDDLSNSDLSAIDGIERIVGQKVEFHHIDCVDKKAMNNLFINNSIAGIIHFAAYKAVGESVGKPLDYYRNNIDSLLTVLELMREYKVENLIFSSSCTVYGQPEILPVTEQTPLKTATSPYGMTKQMAEVILSDTVKAYDDINVIALRYFNPIGAHPSSLIGELSRGVPNNLVPYITQTAAGLRDKVSIYGSDYNTPDGTALRDYIDVQDLARAHVVAMSRLVERKNIARLEFFNIGTGHPLSVLELITTFEKVNNLKLNYEVTSRRKGDIEKVWADTSYAETELGWKAEKTTEDTLRGAWAWEKKLRNI